MRRSWALAWAAVTATSYAYRFFLESALFFIASNLNDLQVYAHADHCNVAIGVLRSVAGVAAMATKLHFATVSALMLVY